MRSAYASFGATVRAATLVASLALATTACGTKDAADPLQPTGPTGRIRFVNLITDPSRNPVNAILEGLPFGVNLAYTGTTPFSLPAPSQAFYAPVYTGGRTLVLKKTADTAVTVATLTTDIAADNDYTVYATGGTAGGAVAGFTLADVNTAPTTGQTRVRVVNMSPTAGAIDVFITAANADLTTATPVATALALRAASTYLSLAPGTYQVRAVPAGTPAGSRPGAVTINLAEVVLTAGTGRTIVTADNTTGGAPLRAFVLNDQ